MSNERKEPLEGPIEEAEAAAQDVGELTSGAMQSAKEALKEGASKAASLLSAAVGPGEEEQPPPKEPDTDLGHAEWEPHAHHGHPGYREPSHHHGHHLPGPLEKMKESAAHAVEGVKMRLHLGSHGGGGGQPTAEQRTGESMHMAKTAEGRNATEDDGISHALHDALKPEKGERPEMSAFPETLGDALAVAQMRDLPNNPTPTSSVAGAESEPTPAAPNPFNAGARDAARSRL